MESYECEGFIFYERRFKIAERKLANYGMTSSINCRSPWWI